METQVYLRNECFSWKVEVAPTEDKLREVDEVFLWVFVWGMIIRSYSGLQDLQLFGAFRYSALVAVMVSQVLHNNYGHHSEKISNSS